MKRLHLLGAALFCLLMAIPAETEAQASRTTTVVKVERNGPAKRQVRRKKRRVRRRTYRTLRKLPATTRVVRFRNIDYYPVAGKFYLARRGVYVRTFPPVGFRVRTLSVSPYRIVVRGRPFWYAQGVFYIQNGEDYVVSETPVGAVVPELPEEAEALDWEGLTAYELNQAVYRQVDGGYEIIELLEED